MWHFRVLSFWGRFRTARAQRQLLRWLSQEHPCKPTPLQTRASGVQNSGPCDPWLPVVENSRLFAQRARSAGTAHGAPPLDRVKIGAVLRMGTQQLLRSPWAIGGDGSKTASCPHSARAQCTPSDVLHGAPSAHSTPALPSASEPRDRAPSAAVLAGEGASSDMPQGSVEGLKVASRARPAKSIDGDSTYGGGDCSGVGLEHDPVDGEGGSEGVLPPSALKAGLGLPCVRGTGCSLRPPPSRHWSRACKASLCIHAPGPMPAHPSDPHPLGGSSSPS